MKRLVIDTDVGTDVDDLFALAYALKHPGIKIEAITTVHGNAVVRGKIARKLERILGKETRILAGENGTLGGGKNYWCGFEQNILGKDELEEELKKEEPIAYDSDVELVCIGPLTNIAMQLENNPSIKNIKRIYIMGSTETSHNFKADPKAAGIVMSYGWDVFQITKEVSSKIVFTRKELEELKGNKLGDFLYSSAINWLNYTGRIEACMYDVLTVSAAIEDFVKFERRDNRFVSCDVNIELKNKLSEAIKNGI